VSVFRWIRGGSKSCVTAITYPEEFGFSRNVCRKRAGIVRKEKQSLPQDHDKVAMNRLQVSGTSPTRLSTMDFGEHADYRECSHCNALSAMACCRGREVCIDAV
jgi:hypothetical protein